MRKVLFGLLLMVSFTAYAAQWELIHSEYSMGNGYICTYQLTGTNYTRTILQQSSCRMFLYN